MNLNIHGSNIKVTDSIKAYLEEKLGKLDKYFDASLVNANVVVRVRGNSQIIEVTIPLKGLTLRAEESHEDLYAAIDLVSDKLERQIRKNKTRLKKKSKDTYLDFNVDFETLDDEVEENPIVKRKTVETKPMDEEEAVLEMNMLGHDFFVFDDVQTGTISVVYKRKDGNYGIIETK